MHTDYEALLERSGFALAAGPLRVMFEIENVTDPQLQYQPRSRDRAHHDGACGAHQAEDVTDDAEKRADIAETLRLGRKASAKP